MTVPTLFLRVGWMDRYRGLAGDQIRGGGEFVKKHGYGHEIFNFKPFQGSVFGYVQPVRGGINEASGSTVNIERLGATKKADLLSGVLAVWVATAPEGGSVIVGWYKNATVFRRWQPPPEGSGREHQGQPLGYYVTAAEQDATLLSRDERLFAIPRGEAGMGQSNVWYADDPDQHRQLRLDVLAFISERRLPVAKPKPLQQPDPLIRTMVERAAVATVVAYYTGLGYTVCSVEEDNVGWDLIAAFEKRELKIEVKGLSGAETRVELTPNEYAKLNLHQESYRICVVTQALTAPQLATFAYSCDSGQWEDQRGRVLDFEEIVAARCRIANGPLSGQ